MKKILRCKLPAHMIELAKMILAADDEPVDKQSMVTNCRFDFHGADEMDGGLDVDRYEMEGVAFFVRDRTLHVVGVPAGCSAIRP